MGFSKVFPDTKFNYYGGSGPSGVSDQPMSDTETYQGAVNRASAAQSSRPKADFWVGIEGGVGYHHDEMEVFAWIVILSKDRMGQARTASFVLPQKIKNLVENGVELGVADYLVFDRKNSKQQSGAVGILTNDQITRTACYEQAVTLALIPFLKRELYS